MSHQPDPWAGADRLLRIEELVQGIDQRTRATVANERLVGGAHALRTLAAQVDAHPASTSYTPAEVADLLRSSATVLDQARTS